MAFPAIIRREHNRTREIQAARAAKRQAYYDAFGEAERADAERPTPVIEPYESPPGADPGPVPDVEPAPEPKPDEPDAAPVPSEPAPDESEAPDVAARATQTAKAAPQPARLASVSPGPQHAQLRPGFQPSRSIRR
jgi:hypothetical protein